MEYFTIKNRLPLIQQPLIVKFLQYIVKNKDTLWSAFYSTCVVYTKTIIHRNGGEYIVVDIYRAAKSNQYSKI